MLDNIKIDRESTTQCALAAKRMRRKEAEIFAELMKKSRNNDHIAQLNEEIGRLEGDMLFAEAKVARRRDYSNKHVDTIRAQALSAPPPSTNVFYKSTSRCASDYIPAHTQVRMDDLMLERTERSSGAVTLLQAGLLTKRNGVRTGTGSPHTAIPLPSIDGRSPNRFARQEATNTKQSQSAAKLIYNDTPFMMSVGRMRSSSPSAIQKKLLASKAQQRDPSAVSEALVSRTTIEGEALSDTDSESEHPSRRTNRPIPTLSDVNDTPWTTRTTHDVLIRDPYMRKHGLHRFNTYLYSEKFKQLIKAADTPQRIVNRDGCDFDYRGNIKGEGMQRGNVALSSN